MLVCVGTSALAQPYTFTELSRPVNPNTGTVSLGAEIVGISRDGRTITGNGFDYRVGDRGDMGSYEVPCAFQYDRVTGNFTFFPSVPNGFGPDNYANRVSRDGSALQIQGGFDHDYYWVNGVGYQRPPSTRSLDLYGVSNNGTMVIGEGAGSPYLGFVYRNGTYITPPPPPGYTRYVPVQLSASGNAFVTTDYPHYYRVDSGWMEIRSVTPPNTVGAGASLLSDDGLSFVGRRLASDDLTHIHIFRWSGQLGYQELFIPTNYGLELLDSTPDLSVLMSVEGYWSAPTGFVELRSLVNSSGVLPSGWRLTELTGVAADGRTFSANFTDAQHYERIGLITVPAPGGVGLLSLGGCLATRRRRGVRRTDVMGTRA